MMESEGWKRERERREKETERERERERRERKRESGTPVGNYSLRIVVPL